MCTSQDMELSCRIFDQHALMVQLNSKNFDRIGSPQGVLLDAKVADRLTKSMKSLLLKA